LQFLALDQQHRPEDVEEVFALPAAKGAIDARIVAELGR
jgi:hypothetical protein